MPLSFNTSIEPPSHGNKTRKIIKGKGIQIGKEEVELSPFVHDVTLHRKPLKMLSESTQN